MRVGFVGLGKLGLPVALAAERAGHEITGCELNPERRRHIKERAVVEAGHEPEMAALLLNTKIKVTSDPTRLVDDCELIFVAVQTPHEPEFEGCVPVEREPRDFDYSHLYVALSDVREARCPVVVISTCLPGTVERAARAVGLTERVIYNPLFIAMGSVIPDYEHPEFVLVGGHGFESLEPLLNYYTPIIDPEGTAHIPLRVMSIRSAELTKVAYNAAIGFKLLLANGIAEIAERTDADADAVMDTLKVADKRLVSTAYMTPGMGDGGGCHPRDQIAMSWLAESTGMSHNPFEMVVKAREAHAKWLADLWVDAAGDRPLVMLGEAYKADTHLTTGSPARLVEHYARARGRRPAVLDTYADAAAHMPRPAAFFIATPHSWLERFYPVNGSLVVDPWGTFECAVDGVELLRPGRR